MKFATGILLLLLMTQSALAIDSAAIPLCRVSEKQITEAYLSKNDPQNITRSKRKLIHQRINTLNNIMAHELSISSRPLYQSVDLPYDIVSYRIKEIIASMNDERINVSVDPSSIVVAQGKIEFKIKGTLKSKLFGEGEEQFSQTVSISNSAANQTQTIDNKTTKYVPTTFSLDGQDYKSILEKLGFEEGYIKTEDEILSITKPVNELQKGLEQALKMGLSSDCYAYLFNNEKLVTHHIVDFNRGNGELYLFSKQDTFKGESSVGIGFSMKID